MNVVTILSITSTTIPAMNDDAYTALRESVMEEARSAAIEQLDGFYTEFPLDSSHEQAELWYEGLQRQDGIFTDRLPNVDLTGQWADAPTWDSILARLTAIEDLDSEEVDELADLYVSTFDQVVYNHVLSTCKTMLYGKED